MTRYHIVGLGGDQIEQVAFTPEEEAAADAEAAAAPPPELPDLEPWRFFSMLELLGKRPALDAFINALPSPQNVIAKNKLDRTLAFHRDNDLVLAAQSALGLSDADLDALWQQAAILS